MCQRWFIWLILQSVATMRAPLMVESFSTAKHLPNPLLICESIKKTPMGRWYQMKFHCCPLCEGMRLWERVSRVILFVFWGDVIHLPRRLHKWPNCATLLKSIWAQSWLLSDSTQSHRTRSTVSCWLYTCMCINTQPEIGRLGPWYDVLLNHAITHPQDIFK